KNGANGISDIEGKAAGVAASECGQRASFKRICAIGRRPSRCGLCAYFRRFRRQPRRRWLESNCSAPELQLALIIEKPFARGAKLSSSRNAAIRCARLKKAPTGWNCSWNRELSPLKSSHLCDKSAKS